MHEHAAAIFHADAINDPPYEVRQRKVQILRLLHKPCGIKHVAL